MRVDREAVQLRVAALVAHALDVPLNRVHAHASLIDDLGAESIDFLDILFRVESEFAIKIPEEEIWQGSFDGTDAASIDAGVQRLRERMPDFRWERLPARIGRDDLPHLITVRTIVDYLERRGVGPPIEQGPQV